MMMGYRFRTDLLTQAIERVRPTIADNRQGTKQRIRALWAAAKAARDYGAHDVVADAFMALAIDANLIDVRGRWTGRDVAAHRRPFGRLDVRHMVDWGLRGLNPFETGPLT